MSADDPKWTVAVRFLQNPVGLTNGTKGLPIRSSYLTTYCAGRLAIQRGRPKRLLAEAIYRTSRLSDATNKATVRVTLSKICSPSLFVADRASGRKVRGIYKGELQ
jgi:hypothetical protein